MKMNLPYSDKVIEHFMNPHNMGEIEGANGIGTVGNPSCGDVMRLFIKVKDNKIEDVKFKTFGCGAAIAVSSMTTEMIKGKSLKEALKISNEEVAKELGGLPPVKMHCSVMAKEALEAAIEDYYSKQKSESSNKSEKNGKYINCCGECEKIDKTLSVRKG